MSEPTQSSTETGAQDDPLRTFSPRVRSWFERVFEEPTPAQAAGWPAISSGKNALISAPTGSGKTLAAFLWGIDRLSRLPDPDPGRAKKDADFTGLGTGTRLVYVSPLKALSYDVERNLRAPLRGVGSPISIGLRTGDTPQAERQAMRRTPPDILITTPESLYLMVTSGVREILTGVEAVIVDEIHAVAQSKRGAHLALTLERLAALVREEGGEDPQRIGLSATQRPLERVAQFLVGPHRSCEVVDAGRRKQLDLAIVVPVEDMSDPGANPVETPGLDDGGDSGPDFGEINPRSIWPAIYPELLALVQEHTSTIIFVNNRRGAERLAKRLNELANHEPEQELPATEHGGHSRAENGGASPAGGAEEGSPSRSNRTAVGESLPRQDPP
ncbi:MAG: DEAD/DEAH box helicase, partial [Solirubrobacterales bacterium]|nr:DEAD/DEAH box helicase [Solirubrobacterales bacterium]